MDLITPTVESWKNSNIQVFWGEIAPCDHSVQIYDNDKSFLNTLEGFAGCGFLSEDSVIIIATADHIKELNYRLRNQGFDLKALQESKRYIALDAEETLSKFMVNDWPDEELFNNLISDIIGSAKTGNRKIRAFGEMVAVLWESGNNGATVHLEHLWNQLHEKESFTLFCAYPKSGFTQSMDDSMNTICKSHSKIIDGQNRPSTQIYYRTA